MKKYIAKYYPLVDGKDHAKCFLYEVQRPAHGGHVGPNICYNIYE